MPARQLSKNREWHFRFLCFSSSVTLCHSANFTKQCNVLSKTHGSQMIARELDFHPPFSETTSPSSIPFWLTLKSTLFRRSKVSSWVACAVKAKCQSPRHSYFSEFSNTYGSICACMFKVNVVGLKRSFRRVTGEQSWEFGIKAELPFFLAHATY